MFGRQGKGGSKETDRIVVTFDVKHKKVTATDMDKPMEVVQVDWEKVNDYLNK